MTYSASSTNLNCMWTFVHNYCMSLLSEIIKKKMVGKNNIYKQNKRKMKDNSK